MLGASLIWSRAVVLSKRWASVSVVIVRRASILGTLLVLTTSVGILVGGRSIVMGSVGGARSISLSRAVCLIA